MKYWLILSVLVLPLAAGTVQAGHPGPRLGDVNADGAINATDALIVLSADAGKDVRRFCPLKCGDVNDDRLVNATDATLILQFSVGLPVSFPLGSADCPKHVNVPACRGKR